MNFLAHCVLGYPDEALVAGGYLGDFIKGAVPDSLPPELQAGVRLHRRVDAVSNRLPGILASVRRFDPELRRAAPVLVDVLADHFLASAFHRFGPAGTALEDFTAEVYQAIDRYRLHVPSAERFFRHMRDTDLLARYTDPAVVTRAMQNVLGRLRGHAHLTDRVHGVLDNLGDELGADFDSYFPELKRAVTEWHEERAAENSRGPTAAR